MGKLGQYLGFGLLVAAWAGGCGLNPQTDPGVASGDDSQYATGGSVASGYTPTGGSSSSGGSASLGVAPEEDEDDYASSGGGAGSTEEEEPAPPLGVNPFVVVEHDPLSTFGADVDTASYDIFRSDVTAGVLPIPDTVRLEEYVNSFDYDYPVPELDAEHPFTVSLAAAPSLFQYDTAILRVGIQGATPPPEAKKQANIVFLVDVSGSMQSAEKLPLVQEVLSHAVDVLESDDTIAIVTYAGSTEVRLVPTPVADAETIKGVIEALSAGGGTNGAAGIDLAYQQAEAGFIEDGINHVILCTDGDFNVGLSSTEELLNLIVAKRQSGITLTTLGFGQGDLNDAMMEAVSDAGNGIYSVISSSKQARDYAENDLLNTLMHIAKDMKLQVEFNPAEVYAYRLLGYEDRAIADDDFRNDVVDAGEVGAGHRVTALYELVLAGHDLPDVTNGTSLDDGEVYDGPVEVDADDLVLVKVRYKKPGASESDPAFEVSSSLAPSAIESDHTSLDADFEWALAIASFAEVMRQSPYAVEDDLPAIENLIDKPVHLEKADRAEFVELFGHAKDLVEAMP